MTKPAPWKPWIRNIAPTKPAIVPLWLPRITERRDAGADLETRSDREFAD